MATDQIEQIALDGSNTSFHNIELVINSVFCSIDLLAMFIHWCNHLSIYRKL